ILEYISVKFQKELTRFLYVLEDFKLQLEFLVKTADTIRGLIIKERELRQRHGFNSIIEHGSDNEIFSYRFSALKKYVNNVLYLTTRPKKGYRVFQEIAYALSAGLAMFVALMLAYFTQLLFPEYSLAFIAAIVIGYMVKDRLKEWGRILIGGRIVLERGYDYKSKIKDQLGNEIGISREKFRFIDYNKVPSDIIEAHNKTRIMNIGIEGEKRPQEIINYVKHIDLYPKVVTRIHKRVLDASDIIRYNISNFLSPMEEAFTRVQWYDIEKNRIENVRTARIYDLVLAIKFVMIDEKNKELSKVDCVQVILDKKGIKRIEKGFSK
ncbi:MAG: hypothetical protein ACFFD4_30260, partial [Candidatus Odinarchaeota archaeon]